MLVFDYLDAVAFVPAHQFLALQQRFERAWAAGEPSVTGFAPQELARLWGALGYAIVEELRQPEQTARYFRHRADGIRPAGYWHWVHARLV